MMGNRALCDLEQISLVILKRVIDCEKTRAKPQEK